MKDNDPADELNEIAAKCEKLAAPIDRDLKSTVEKVIDAIEAVAA